MLTSSTLATEYLTLASQCRTVNQFNKLHIRLEKLLAPSEIGYLSGLGDIQQLPSLTYEWLRKLAGFSPGIIDSPQRFKRQPLSEHIVLYQDPDCDEVEKSLLIAFCGNGGRLGMPISVFLQCLSSRHWDVMVLHKGPQKRPYMAGLEGVANSLSGVVRYIRNATTARYKRVITLGASAGGYAAVLTAVLMNTARGISICGSPPQAPLSLWFRWRLRKASERHKPELLFVHGADSERDRAASLLMLNALGGKLHPVPSIGEHNVLFALFKRGQIAEFLHEVLA
jgi:hypothetical protein